MGGVIRERRLACTSLLGNSLRVVNKTKQKVIFLDRQELVEQNAET